MDSPSRSLAPPAVSQLRTEQAGPMERSLSQDIREEREDLREAAESTLNCIVDLNLDGTIKWASPSWTDVVGTRHESLASKSMSDLIVGENKHVFSEVVESMNKDDSKSHRVRFALELGPLSKLRSIDPTEDPEQPQRDTIDFEAQGIMVYDGVSGGDSHVRIPETSPIRIAVTNMGLARLCG